MRKLWVLGAVMVSFIGLTYDGLYAQQAVTATRSIASTDVQAGDSVQVTVTIQPNAGTISGMALQEQLPSGWTIVDQSSDPTSTFSSRDNTWLWISQIESAVTVQYTVQIASDAASGTFEVEGTVQSASPAFSVPVGGDSQITVSGGGGATSVAQALDVNQNNVLDDAEVLVAIQLWVGGQPVEGTDGKTIDDEEILRLIDLWVKGLPIES